MFFKNYAFKKNYFDVTISRSFVDILRRRRQLVYKIIIIYDNTCIQKDIEYNQYLIISNNIVSYFSGISNIS